MADGQLGPVPMSPLLECGPSAKRQSPDFSNVRESTPRDVGDCQRRVSAIRGDYSRGSRVSGVDVTSEIVIARPVEEVAAYSANPDNAPAWYVNIKSVEWQTAPPLNVGSKVAFVAQFLGRRLAYVYELVEFVPGKRLAMRTSEGPFPMETIYTWDSIGDGKTRMTLRNSGSPRGFSKLVAPFMSFAMRRANRKDLSRLRELLEQTQPGPET
jgi:uncharacterized membrane protein